MLAEVGRRRAKFLMLVEFARRRVKLGRSGHWPKSGDTWPMQGQSWSRQAEFGSGSIFWPRPPPRSSCARERAQGGGSGTRSLQFFPNSSANVFSTSECGSAGIESFRARALGGPREHWAGCLPLNLEGGGLTKKCVRLTNKRVPCHPQEAPTHPRWAS